MPGSKVIVLLPQINVAGSVRDIEASAVAQVTLIDRLNSALKALHSLATKAMKIVVSLAKAIIGGLLGFRSLRGLLRRFHTSAMKVRAYERAAQATEILIGTLAGAAVSSASFSVAIELVAGAFSSAFATGSAMARAAEEAMISARPLLLYLVDVAGFIGDAGSVAAQSVVKLVVQVAEIITRYTIEVLQAVQRVAKNPTIREFLDKYPESWVTLYAKQAEAFTQSGQETIEAIGKSLKAYVESAGMGVVREVVSFKQRRLDAIREGAALRSARGVIHQSTTLRPFVSEILEAIKAFATSSTANDVASYLRSVLTSTEQKLSGMIGGLKETLSRLAERASSFAIPPLAAILEGTVGLTEGFEMVAAQAERIAASNSSTAKLVQRAQLIFVGTSALFNAIIQTAKAIAAFASLLIPQGILHALAASLFATAAGLAFAFAGGGVTAPKGSSRERSRGTRAFVGDPDKFAELNLIVDSSVAINDPEWVRTHILIPISTGGRRVPEGTRYARPPVHRPSVGIIDSVRGAAGSAAARVVFGHFSDFVIKDDRVVLARAAQHVAGGQTTDLLGRAFGSLGGLGGFGKAFSNSLGF